MPFLTSKGPSATRYNRAMSSDILFGHLTLANQFQNHSSQQPNNCIILCLLPTYPTYPPYPNFPQYPKLCKALSIVRSSCVKMRH